MAAKSNNDDMCRVQYKKPNKPIISNKKKQTGQPHPGESERRKARERKNNANLHADNAVPE
jgi:hypothetical protein